MVTRKKTFFGELIKEGSITDEAEDFKNKKSRGYYRIFNDADFASIQDACFYPIKYIKKEGLEPDDDVEACAEAAGEGAWTGSRCCGDDTNKDGSEFYNDDNVWCFAGTVIESDGILSDAEEFSFLTETNLANLKNMISESGSLLRSSVPSISSGKIGLKGIPGETFVFEADVAPEEATSLTIGFSGTHAAVSGTMSSAGHIIIEIPPEGSVPGTGTLADAKKGILPFMTGKATGDGQTDDADSADSGLIISLKLDQYTMMKLAVIGKNHAAIKNAKLYPKSARKVLHYGTGLYTCDADPALSSLKETDDNGKATSTNFFSPDTKDSKFKFTSGKCEGPKDSGYICVAAGWEKNKGTFYREKGVSITEGSVSGCCEAESKCWDGKECVDTGSLWPAAKESEETKEKEAIKLNEGDTGLQCDAGKWAEGIQKCAPNSKECGICQEDKCYDGEKCVGSIGSNIGNTGSNIDSTGVKDDYICFNGGWADKLNTIAAALFSLSQNGGFKDHFSLSCGDTEHIFNGVGNKFDYAVPSGSPAAAEILGKAYNKGCVMEFEKGKQGLAAWLNKLFGWEEASANKIIFGLSSEEDINIEGDSADYSLLNLFDIAKEGIMQGNRHSYCDDAAKSPDNIFQYKQCNKKNMWYSKGLKSILYTPEDDGINPYTGVVPLGYAEVLVQVEELLGSAGGLEYAGNPAMIGRLYIAKEGDSYIIAFADDSMMRITYGNIRVNLCEIEPVKKSGLNCGVNVKSNDNFEFFIDDEYDADAWQKLATGTRLGDSGGKEEQLPRYNKNWGLPAVTGAAITATKGMFDIYPGDQIQIDLPRDRINFEEYIGYSINFPDGKIASYMEKDMPISGILIHTFEKITKDEKGYAPVLRGLKKDYTTEQIEGFGILNLHKEKPKCASDNECVKGSICENNKCAEGCRTNDNCPYKQACKGGKCAGIECWSNAECIQNRREEVAEKLRDAPPAEKERFRDFFGKFLEGKASECLNPGTPASECKYDYTCADNVCVLGDNIECTDNAACSRIYNDKNYGCINYKCIKTKSIIGQAIDLKKCFEERQTAFEEFIYKYTPKDEKEVKDAEIVIKAYVVCKENYGGLNECIEGDAGKYAEEAFKLTASWEGNPCALTTSIVS